MPAEPLKISTHKRVVVPALLSRMALTLLAAWAMLLLNSCEIEETVPPQTGSVLVTLAGLADDTTRTPIDGAAILIDERSTPRKTPATLSGIPVGMHRISTFMPRFVHADTVVDVVANQTVRVDLVTTAVYSGSIDLAGAPDGTLLLINNVPVDTVPTAMDPPTLFSGLGLGTFRVSAYRAGYATEFPAPWTITLSADQPTTLSPIFASIPEGHKIGDLAPVFDLTSDWENTHYRLQDYRGQVVLVTFFFSNCTACIEEFPHIQSVFDDPAYQGKLLVLGLNSVDPYRTFARFRDDHPSLGLTFPLLHDATQSVRAAYGVTTNPANFLIDQKGRVRMARGGVTEPELRQQIDALVGNGRTGTFRFEMRETNIEYTDGDQTFEFHATVANLLAQPRSFVFTLDPVIYPDTNRPSSICVGLCTPPQIGTITYTVQFDSMRVDSSVYFSIYNFIVDPDSQITVPSPIHGDYTLDVLVSPADNPADSVAYRLLLDDMSGSFLARTSHGAWLR